MIESIEKFIESVRRDLNEQWYSVSLCEQDRRGERSEAHRRACIPWFRGECATYGANKEGKKSTDLLPSLFRALREPSALPDLENRLIQHFRQRAILLGETPDRSATDQWLFLMQHNRIPTRLLDWTEGALASLYFALKTYEPVVWMLNPFGLNRLLRKTEPSVTIGGQVQRLVFTDADLPLTWNNRSDGVDAGHVNIRAAWELAEFGTNLPVAIRPTDSHARMRAQRSCFTVHGRNICGLRQIISEAVYQGDGSKQEVPGYLHRYLIDPSKKQAMENELRWMGISESSIYPDFPGLAEELKRLYCP